MVLRYPHSSAALAFPDPSFVISARSSALRGYVDSFYGIAARYLLRSFDYIYILVFYSASDLSGEGFGKFLDSAAQRSCNAPPGVGPLPRTWTSFHSRRVAVLTLGLCTAPPPSKHFHQKLIGYSFFRKKGAWTHCTMHRSLAYYYYTSS